MAITKEKKLIGLLLPLSLTEKVQLNKEHGLRGVLTLGVAELAMEELVHELGLVLEGQTVQAAIFRPSSATQPVALVSY